MAGRESYLPLPPGSDFLQYLDQCVEATESCVQTFHDGLRRLEPGTHDLLRLTKILRNQHHYLVLPAPVVAAHKNALCESLGPQVDQLISRSDTLVNAQTDHVKRLEERLSILESARPARQQPAAVAAGSTAFAQSHPGAERETASNPSTSNDAEEDESGSYLEDLDMKELNMQQRRKVIMLRGKRKRLEEERAALLAQQPQ